MIAEALEQGRNAKVIWQDLVDRHGFPQHYESVKRYVRRLRGSVVSLAHPTIVTALARRRRSSTATARWCAIRSGRSTGGRGSSR